jgi:hypothetical protein
MSTATRKALLIASDRHSFTPITRIGGQMSEQQAKDLINELRDVRSKTLRRLMLKDYIEKLGEVPERYKEAVTALTK